MKLPSNSLRCRSQNFFSFINLVPSSRCKLYIECHFRLAYVNEWVCTRIFDFSQCCRRSPQRDGWIEARKSVRTASLTSQSLNKIISVFFSIPYILDLLHSVDRRRYTGIYAAFRRIVILKYGKQISAKFVIIICFSTFFTSSLFTHNLWCALRYIQAESNTNAFEARPAKHKECWGGEAERQSGRGDSDFVSVVSLRKRSPYFHARSTHLCQPRVECGVIMCTQTHTQNTIPKSKLS